MPFKTINYVLLLAITALTGCTQKFNNTTDTLSEAFLGFDDVTVTKQQVLELPYASIYARINGGQRIFMVLAFAEPNPMTGTTQLKWLSSDSAMIVTENGRITKTLYLPTANLSGISSSKPIAAPSTSKHNWEATYDWQPGYQHGHKVNITSQASDMELVSSLIWQGSAQKIQETVTFINSHNSMENEYWVNSEGNIVKSSQWLIPDKLHVELEVLKPYAAE